MPKSDPHTWLADHGDYLFRYALLQVRNDDIAADLVQDTLLAALRAQGEFRGESALRTWLTGILKHKIIDHFRAAQRTVALADVLPDDADDDAVDAFFMADGHHNQPPQAWANAESALEQQQFWAVMKHCLGGMPARQRQAFMMREFHGMDADEMCKNLEVTSTNLWVLLHRARLWLRACLEQHWFGTQRG